MGRQVERQQGRQMKKGKWKGKQLLPESWINEATSKQTPSRTGDNDWSQGYGYQFWRCKPGFYRGDGAYGQFCMVMPEQDAVLVMTSESWNLQKSMDVAYQTLLPAMSATSLAENTAELSVLKKELSQLSLPVTKGSKTSSIASKYSNKLFNCDKNSFGITQVGFGLFEDAGVLRINEGNGIQKIGFGWEQWKVNPNKRIAPFHPNPKIAMPSKIASTATWLNDNTLQINLKFVEAIHGDKLTVTFADNKVEIAFLNSVSENTKNNPDKREKLTGIIS